MVARAAPSGTANRPSVLVIDDDGDVREYLDVFLAIEGFEVTTLADPSFAIERIRGEVFDLILLDQMMPKIDGLELLARIRAVDDDIAVIMITGHPTLETAWTSIRYGISAYLGHPILPTQLREAIARITKHRRFVRRREAELCTAIGRHLRDLREARGLTLRALARRANLSISLLSRLEGDPSSAPMTSCPPVSILLELAAALDVRLIDLLGAAAS